MPPFQEVTLTGEATVFSVPKFVIFQEAYYLEIKSIFPSLIVILTHEYKKFPGSLNRLHPDIIPKGERVYQIIREEPYLELYLVESPPVPQLAYNSDSGHPTYGCHALLCPRISFPAQLIHRRHVKITIIFFICNSPIFCKFSINPGVQGIFLNSTCV